MAATESSLHGQVTSTGTCLLCGSSDDDIVLVDNGHCGRRCSCGVVYIDPRPGPADLETIEDSHADGYYRDPAAVRLAFIDRVRERHLPPSRRRLLEIGAGRGHLLALARRAGYRVATIEPDPARAAALRASGIDTEQALLQDTALDDASFDIVFHVDLLSHFARPAAALAIMKRLAGSGGLVCFEVGVFGGLSKRWYRWVGRAGYPQHLWFYSHENLQRLFDETGLEVVERRDFSLWAGTIVSTIGARCFDRRFATLSRISRVSRPTRRRRAYDRLQRHLRYTIGGLVPSFGGPQCSFFALRAGDGGETA